MMNKFEIRPAAFSDGAALAALAVACFDTPWTKQQLINAAQGENSRILAAVLEDGTICGMLALSWLLDEASVDDVAVLPEYRRRGLATALLKNALLMAAEMGAAAVLLEVRASNAAGRALYEKHGFKTVGLRRGYYEKPREDAVLMTKFLR